MRTIALEIAKGLKEGKWVSVEYRNQNLGKNTFFWIGIKDIVPKKRLLIVDMFNYEKGMETIEGKIYFDQLAYAQVIEGTFYPRSEELLKRIQENFSDYSFLEYTGVNDRVLHYYMDCYYQDKDVTVKQYTLIEGIDEEALQSDCFSLTEEDFIKVIKDLQKHLRLRSKINQQQILRLAMNVLSVNTKHGLFPIVYRGVNLDIKSRKMVLDASLSFNTKMTANAQELYLHRYLDCSLMEFMENFALQREYYTQEILSNLNRFESIDERPYLFELKKHMGVNIELEYKELQKQYENNMLTYPCQAFFGTLEKERPKRKRNPLMVHNVSVNIDQYRVIHNAMNKNIVYVQGPPGTGKTATIVNTVLSCLLNRFSALIVSNNNEAIDHIYQKLMNFTYRKAQIALPVLRLGSNEHILQTLDRLYREQVYFASLANDRESVSYAKELEEKVIGHFQQVNEMIADYEAEFEIEEQIESLEAIIQRLQNSTEGDEVSRNLAIAGIQAQIQNIRLQTEGETPSYKPIPVDEELICEYLFYLSCVFHRKLQQKKNKGLRDILLMKDKKERAKEFLAFLKTKEGMTQLLDCFPIIISTNISVSKIDNSEPHFDLMIMDEASQCNNALALLPMMRCKRALFVGDQNQLQPVVVLNTVKNEELIRTYDIPYSYDYKKNSMLSTLLSVDTLSKFILLRDHYRCHEKIITFANQKYYGDELRIRSRLDNIDALQLIDIASNANDKNVSMEEIHAIIQEIKKISHQDVAVITPFRAQANRLSAQLERHGLDYVKVGTIHTFQGDEKDTVILSCAISQSTFQQSFDWVKNNQELINVATTRAKRKLILVCDHEKIKELSHSESNDLLELAEYVQRNGDYNVNYKENKLFQSKVKSFKYYNTVFEEEFLKTLLHFKSVYQSFEVKSKVKITDVLHLKGDNRKLFSYGNQAHFDFVLYDLNQRPLLVVEVIGSEHLSDVKVMERDRKKQEICDKEGILLLTVRNDYVRRYQYIKDSILDALR